MDDTQRNAFLEHIHQKIDEYGVTIIAVGADPETGDTQFAYTIGLAEKHGCELAMNGAPFEDMHYILNQVAKRINDGVLEPRDGLMVEGVLEGGYVVRLKQADPTRAACFPWIRIALGLAEFPAVWQVQYPAHGGQFPGQDGYDIDPQVQLDYTISLLNQGA
ncbi:MAG: DUF4262 domain-containing protein [Marmoricola sp.]|jgi:hypothetical protein